MNTTLSSVKFDRNYVRLVHLALIPHIILLFYIANYSASHLNDWHKEDFDLSNFTFEYLPALSAIAYGSIWAIFRKEKIWEIYSMPYLEKWKKYPLQFTYINLMILPYLWMIVKATILKLS